MANGINVYVAAPLSQRELASERASELESNGFKVVSRWHETARYAVDPSDHEERRDVLNSNEVDLRRADALLAVCHVGAPRATFTEIGWALGRELPVVWLQERSSGHHGGGNIFDASSLVRILPGKTATVTEIAGAFGDLLKRKSR